MHYSYLEIEYIATGFSPAGMDLALKLLSLNEAQENLWHIYAPVAVILLRNYLRVLGTVIKPKSMYVFLRM